MTFRCVQRSLEKAERAPRLEVGVKCDAMWPSKMNTHYAGTIESVERDGIIGVKFDKTSKVEKVKAENVNMHMVFYLSDGTEITEENR